MGLQFYQSFSHAVVHFGDIPKNCTARVEGHDQTILHERPSEVTLNDPAIQANVRASGDRLVDKDQQQKRLDLIRNCVTSILQAPSQKRGKWTHAQRSCTVTQGHTDITKLIVADDTTLCEKYREHNVKWKSFCTCGVIPQEF